MHISHKVVFSVALVLLFIYGTTGVVHSKDEYENFFRYSHFGEGTAPENKSWFTVGFGEDKPLIGDTLETKFIIHNAESSVSDVRLRVYHSLEVMDPGSNPYCSAWNLSKATLINEVNIGTINANATLNTNINVPLSSSVFTAVSDSHLPALNNLIFEVYSPKNALGLDCTVYNRLIEGRRTESTEDLEVTHVTVQSQPTSLDGTAIISLGIRNNGKNMYQPDEGARVCLRKREFGSYIYMIEDQNLCRGLELIGPKEELVLIFATMPIREHYTFEPFVLGENRMIATIETYDRSFVEKNYDNNEKIFSLYVGEKTTTKSVGSVSASTTEAKSLRMNKQLRILNKKLEKAERQFSSGKIKLKRQVLRLQRNRDAVLKRLEQLKTGSSSIR